MLVELSPEEFDRILTALDWYIDDREECAKYESRCPYDAGADDSLRTARKASVLLDKLRKMA